MAKVQGVKEKLHSPVYDAFFVKADPAPPAIPNKTFTDFMTDSRVIRFFVDIQNKTKLETNLQGSGVLPSLNTFEARALRVVVSSLRVTCPPAAGYSLAASTKEKEIKSAVIEAVTEGEILADLIYNSVTSRQNRAGARFFATHQLTGEIRCLQFLSSQTRAPLSLHPPFWRWLPQTQNITNPRCVSNKQVNAEVRPRSGLMTRIPTLSLSRPIRSLQRGNMRSPFSRTSYRSMAATPMILPLRRSSCFRGKQRAAMSESGQPANLEEDRVSSRLLIALSRPVDPAGGGILYVEDGALKYRGSKGTVTIIAPA